MRYVKGLLLTILIGLTNCSTRTNAKETSPNIIHLEAGKIAPFAGALVPKYKFESMESILEQKVKFQGELAKCEESEMELQESNRGQGMSFVAGFVSGAFLLWLGSQVGNKR